MFQHNLNYVRRTKGYAKAIEAKENAKLTYGKVAAIWNRVIGAVVAVAVLGGAFFMLAQYGAEEAARQLQAAKAECAAEAQAVTDFEYRYDESTGACEILVLTQEGTQFWLPLWLYSN